MHCYPGCNEEHCPEDVLLSSQPNKAAFSTLETPVLCVCKDLSIKQCYRIKYIYTLYIYIIFQ